MTTNLDRAVDREWYVSYWRTGTVFRYLARRKAITVVGSAASAEQAASRMYDDIQEIEDHG
jgi:hypothetical protein